MEEIKQKPYNQPEEPDESETIEFHNFRMTPEHLRRFKAIYERKHRKDTTRDPNDLTVNDKGILMRREFPDVGQIQAKENYMSLDSLPEGHCGQKHLADLLGCSVARVRLFMHYGYFVKDATGFYDIKACKEAFAKYDPLIQKRTPHKRQKRSSKCQPKQTITEPVSETIPETIPESTAESGSTGINSEIELLKELLERVTAGNAVITRVKQTYTFSIDLE
jgi:hypothetical protein